MKSENIYIAACSDNGEGGIYRFRRSGDKLVEIDFTALETVSYLAFSPDRRFLYCTRRFSDPYAQSSAVAAFLINSDGSLKFLNTVSTRGLSSCHLTCDPLGRFLYCSNYMTGSLTVFSLSGDGRVDELLQLIEHHGSGPRSDRQESAHPHCTVLSPDKRFLTVADLGMDRLMLYALDSKRGLVEETAFSYSLPPGAGPRHAVFNAAGNGAYVVNELDNTVAYFTYESGKMRHIQTVPTLPDDFSRKNTAAAIRISADGRFVLASNRGHDSIACFLVADDNTLTLVGIFPVGGRGPRDFNFLPGGDLIASANEDSHDVQIMRFDRKSGTIALPHQAFRMPRPLCVIY